MPAPVYDYADASARASSPDCWVCEPASPYDAGHPIPDICKVLGRNIRRQRMLRRWSQEALGLAAGVNRTLIGAIERAEINTSIGTADKIARAFGLSVADLLRVRVPGPSGSLRDKFDG